MNYQYFLYLYYELSVLSVFILWTISTFCIYTSYGASTCHFPLDVSSMSGLSTEASNSYMTYVLYHHTDDTSGFSTYALLLLQVTYVLYHHSHNSGMLQYVCFAIATSYVRPLPPLTQLWYASVCMVCSCERSWPLLEECTLRLLLRGVDIKHQWRSLDVPVG